MAFILDNIWSILMALGAVLLYAKLKKRFDYFADRGMHCVQRSWIDALKSLWIINFAKSPNVIYSKESRSGKSYVGFFQFVSPKVLVLHPSLVEKILVKDFSSFEDHGIEIDCKANPLLGHLFNMKGDQWRTLRRKLVPTFTSGKLKGMVPIMEECAQDMIQQMKQDSSLTNDTDLKELFRKYSLSVIASCAFGIDPKSVKDETFTEFRRIMNKIVGPNILILMKFGLTLALPSVARAIGLKLFSQDVTDFALNFMRQSFEMRNKSGVKRNDFIQLLLELKEKGHVQVDLKDLEQDERENIQTIDLEPPTQTLELTEELLMAQVFVFLFAGFENIAYLVAITTYALSKHPEIQNRVREEVKQVKSRHKCLDYLAIRDMKLLEACVDEVLRLYSPTSILLRLCTKTFTLDDGMKIEKGTQVIIPTDGFHHDPKYWHNPKEFDPDRFLSSEKPRPGTYMPFGDGPRICIAQRMALLISKLMLAKLLENFELLPSPKTKEPIEVVALGVADVRGGLWGSFDVLT